MSVLMPAGSMALQEVVDNRDDGLDGLQSKINGVGSAFVPEESEIELYQESREEE